MEYWAWRGYERRYYAVLDKATVGTWTPLYGGKWRDALEGFSTLRMRRAGRLELLLNGVPPCDFVTITTSSS